MNSIVVMLLAFLWGLLLGLAYFGGLWLTLQALVNRASKHVGLIFLSFVLRLTLALAGMWIVLKINPLAFFITLASFLMVRPFLTMTMRRTLSGEEIWR